MPVKIGSSFAEECDVKPLLSGSGDLFCAMIPAAPEACSHTKPDGMTLTEQLLCMHDVWMLRAACTQAARHTAYSINSPAAVQRLFGVKQVQV